MLISHRTNAYVDNSELERTVGMLKQRMNSGTLDNAHEIALFDGAIIALQILQMQDLKSAENFFVVFNATLGIYDKE